MSLRARVRLVLLVLVGLSFLAVIVALVGGPARDRARARLDHVSSLQLEVEELRSAMLDQETGLRGYILTNEERFLEPYLAGRAAAAKRTSELRGALVHEQRARTALDAALSARVAWEAAAARARARPDSSDIAGASDRKALFDTLRTRLDALSTAVGTLVARADHHYRTTRTAQEWSLYGTVVLAGLSALGASVLLLHWLSVPLARLGQSLQALADDPDAQLTPHGPPELAALAGQVDQARRSILDESVRRVRRGLVVAQEEERRRIAIGLHDVVIQDLSAALLRLDVLGRHAADSNTDTVAAGRAAITDAVEHLRTLLFELHPPALDRHGLVAALDAFAEGMTDDLDVIVKVGGSVEAASSAVQSLAYRATREVIVNAVKHAGANEISVEVVASDGGIGVRVADDGQGFDPAGVAPRPGHLGLAAAEELVVGSEGTWSLRSTPGKGTVVELWVPDPGEA